jgi:hypothetical protein
VRNPTALPLILRYLCVRACVRPCVQLDRWSTWFDKKFGKFTKDPRHHEGMKSAALMTVLIIFMFLPQWFFKVAVP